MNQVQNILIVDDEKSNIDILLDLFEKIDINNNYNIVASLCGEKALKAIEKRKIDLILLDIMMPGIDGYEVCKKIKSNPDTKHIPILFITSNTDDESISKAYSVGASDFVTKPFRSVELLARVKVNLQLQQTINQLEYFAFYDAMTGVYNRRKFFELAIERFENKKENLFGIMLDIDRFKAINDTYGHWAGDKVIKEVANTIKNQLPKDAVLGRIGGEEFAIVLCDCLDDEVVEFVENVRKTIEKIDFILDENRSIKCTISDGVAKNKDEFSTIDQLLQKADEALYEAKNSGRNKSIFRI